MQGRLCDCVDGKIQAFPWDDWEKEFTIAAAIKFHLIEWTLDYEDLYKNPLMTAYGQKKILSLCQKYGISILSLTGDCFMQQPFWKVSGQAQADLKSDLLEIIRACSVVGIQMIVIPLVDSGRIDTKHQENELVHFLLEQHPYLLDHRIQIIFESDFPPDELRRFISRFPLDSFGINYDVGNSAALGYNTSEELASYGSRVLNVHVKDRLLRGTTVPLKAGNANFKETFIALAKQHYKGNFILQTARAGNGVSHVEALCNYRDMTQQWIHQFM